MDDKAAVTSLVSIAQWISYLITLALVVGVGIVLLKCFGTSQASEEASDDTAAGPQFTFMGVSLPINRAWLPFAILTVAHAYFTFLFFRDLCTIFACESSLLAARAWQELSGEATKLFWFFGLGDRAEIAPSEYIPQALRISTMNSDLASDPVMLAHIAGALICFLAMIRLKRASLRLKLVTFALAVVITATNWTIGSYWALGALDLRDYSKNEPLVNSRAYGHFIERMRKTKCATVSGTEESRS